MKKFARLMIEIIIVLLPFWAVWVHCGSDVLSYIDDEAPNYIANREFVRSAHDEYYGIITLGDSTANSAYDPKFLSDETINLSLGGTTPAENYYILKEWVEHNPAPHDVFMSFNVGQLRDDHTFWYRTMYAHRFDLSENLDIFKNGLRSGSEVMGIDSRVDDFVAYSIYFPSKYITAVLNAGYNGRLSENEAAMKLWEDNRGRYIAVNTDETLDFVPEEEDTFDVSYSADHYYHLILSLCKENGITPHIVMLPTTVDQMYSDKYYREFDEYYDALKKEYPELTVDRFGDYDYTLMQDKWHLNSNGAEKLCTELKGMYPEVFEK